MNYDRKERNNKQEKMFRTKVIKYQPKKINRKAQRKIQNSRVKAPVPRRPKLEPEQMENEQNQLDIANNSANDKIFEESEKYKNIQVARCPEGCGRSFNILTLSKHQKICKKIFVKKRKKWDSHKQRKYIEGGAPDEVRRSKNRRKKQKKQKKLQKWKLQSAQLRNVIRQGRGEDVSNTREN